MKESWLDVLNREGYLKLWELLMVVVMCIWAGFLIGGGLQ